MPSNVERKLYYSHNLNPRVAVAVAKYLQSPVEYIRFEPMGADKEMCRPLNPNTRAPVLVEAGQSLWETDAIALKLSMASDVDFWPGDRQAEMMMWVSWSAHHFTLAGSAFYFENIIVPQIFNRPADENLLRQAGEDFREFAVVLDGILASRTWLVGDRVTYSDFRVATALPFAERARLPIEGFSNILRWRDQLNEIEAWREPFAGID